MGNILKGKKLFTYWWGYIMENINYNNLILAYLNNLEDRLENNLPLLPSDFFMLKGINYILKNRGKQWEY